MQVTTDDFRSQLEFVVAKLAEFQERSSGASAEAQLVVAREGVQFLGHELIGTIMVATLLADRLASVQADLDAAVAQLAAMQPASVA